MVYNLVWYKDSRKIMNIFKRGKNSMKWKKILTIGLILICLLIGVFFVKAYQDGEFNSVESLQSYVGQFGIFGPLILTLIQAVQVVIPILPGFLGCAVGAVLFGWCWGFLCNYIGISLGSVIAFLLARKYGVQIVKTIFPEKKYVKYSEKAGNSKSYVQFLFWGMVLPLFPDDFLCYFSGLTTMRTKKFVKIILLGKPWCILVYSIFFSMI